jgi:L-asparaginase II
MKNIDLNLQENIQKSQSALQVGVFRGEYLESVHKVHAVVVNSLGQKILSFGQVEQKIFPRSSIKPIQAVPLITTGAYDAKNVTLAELALSCASHSGEKIHFDNVSAWLDRLSLTSSDLQCGTHHPSSIASTIRMAQDKIEYSAVCNNCSGKHTGMLCHALHMKNPTKDYIHYEHPVQQRVKHAIEEFCNINLNEKDYGIDGCSIPSFFIPMDKFALGMARIAEPTGLSLENSKAAALIFQACTENPILVAGSERYCTRVMLRTNKKVLIKTGAEGVMAA